MFGKDRYLAEGAELGFHAPALLYPPADPEMRAREEQMMMVHHRGMIAMLPRPLPKSFIDRWMDTPSTSIWIPGRSELIAAGIIGDDGSTQPVDATTATGGVQQ